MSCTCLGDCGQPSYSSCIWSCGHVVKGSGHLSRKPTEYIANVNCNHYPLQNICPLYQGKNQENILHKKGGTVTKSSYPFFR